MSEKKSGINPKLIRDIAHILKESNLSEIEVQISDFKIRISNVIETKTTLPVSSARYTQACYEENLSPAPAAPLPPAVSKRSDVDLLKSQVVSPMVGTAYSASSPGAKPFIEIGQMVEEGQTLLIIEAMKTMNQIPAPRSGKIKEIYFQNGHPVEFGEALVAME